MRMRAIVSTGVAAVALLFSGCPIGGVPNTFEIWLINGSSYTIDTLTISDSNPTTSKASLEILKGDTVPPNGFKIIKGVSNSLFQVGSVSTVWYTADTTDDVDASVGPTQGGIPTGSIIPLLLEGDTALDLELSLLSFQDNVKALGNVALVE